MINKINAILLLILFSGLAGCLNYEQITTIRKDHSGKMFIHYWKNISSADNEKIIRISGLFIEDSLRSKFNAGFVHINRIEVFKNKSDGTIHAQIDFEFSDVDSLNKLGPFKFSKIKIERTSSGAEIFTQEIRSFARGFSQSDSTYSFLYEFYLPGEIISHNANQKSRNKLTWKFSSDNFPADNLMKAEYIPFKLQRTPPLIYLLAGAMLTIIIVFLFKKK